MSEKPRKKHERETDYRAYFIFGLCIFAMGISLVAAFSLAFIGFLALGVVFMLIGLSNRDKWVKSRKKT